MVKVVMELHHGNLKVVGFMMKLHYWSFNKGEASVEASPYGLLYLYELVSN